MTDFDKARSLLKEFKGDSYLFGNGVLSGIGKLAASVGGNAALFFTEFPGVEIYVKKIREALSKSAVKLLVETKGADANAPRQDVFRIAGELKKFNPDVIISFGGGSTIDAVKAAEVLHTVGGKIDDYFGMGFVTEALNKSGKKLIPHIAIQTAASSGSHLTKYSNITDITTGQKKLIIDTAVAPQYAVFDYTVTYNAPIGLTSDGAMDGLAHIIEVLYSAVGKPYYRKMEDVAKTGIKLALDYLPVVLENPKNVEAREALCLATDLGGYSIMLGGTNGAHLTSFSLVDILSHGRACAIMEPYYTVFFAPAIEGPLQLLAKAYKNAGLTKADIKNAKGRELSIIVAEAMFEFAKRIGFPTKLGEVKGFSQNHISRALTAAKDPQLKSKLQNMPVPLTAEMVDEFMQPVLEAARNGNIAIIKNV
jgi:alcohol dehydrogenase class IV